MKTKKKTKAKAKKEQVTSKTLKAAAKLIPKENWKPTSVKKSDVGVAMFLKTY